MLPPRWRRVVLLSAVGLLVAVASACGDEEVLLGTKPSPTIVQDTKPEDPNEVENNPGPINTGPAASPRPCPECFAKPVPKPDPGPPCAQKALASNPEPDYGSIIEPSVDGWSAYTSTNYDFSFKYPPDWQIRVMVNDVYGWAGDDGVLDSQQVRGPPTEIITLYNPLWWEVIGPPETAPQIDLAPVSGIGKVDIVYGPGGRFQGERPCEPAFSGNPNQSSVTVGGLPATALLNTIEPPDSEPTHYFLGLDVDPNESTHMTLAGHSWGESSNLVAAKGVLSTIRFSQ